LTNPTVIGSPLTGPATTLVGASATAGADEEGTAVSATDDRGDVACATVVTALWDAAVVDGAVVDGAMVTAALDDALLPLELHAPATSAKQTTAESAVRRRPTSDISRDRRLNVGM
jgi:hypothetical protein